MSSIGSSDFSAVGNARRAGVGREPTPWPHIVACVLVGALFAIFALRQSLDQGLLAFPITYDDTTYYGDGLSMLHAVQDRGPLALLDEWGRQPPHSPWSALVAFAGFALFGPTDWAPAAAAGMLLVAALAALAVALRELPVHLVALTAAAFVTWPYFGHVVSESRPDMAWGLLVALFVALACRMIDRPLALREQVAAGLVLGAALLAKTSTFPVTLAIVGTSLIGAAVAASLRAGGGAKPGARPVREIASILAVGLAVALPHYVAAQRNIYRYIETNVFGDRARIWELKMSALDHLTYHLTGPGGATMMGAWLWAACAVIAVFLVQAARDGNRVELARAGVYAASLGVAFAAVTVPAHKSPHIGAVVPGMIAVAWLYATAHLYGRWRASRSGRAISAVVGVALVVFGLAQFTWHSTARYGPPQEDRYAEIRDRHAVLRRTLESIAESDPAARIHVVGTTRYLNAETLAYYARKARYDGLRFDDDVFSADVGRTMSRIAESGGVVLFTPDNDELVRSLPSAAPDYLAAVGQRIAADAGLRKVASSVARTGTGEAVVYLRAAPFARRAEYKGFGPIEGPYPHMGLPRVRWGYGPRSSLRLPAGVAGRRLVLQAQTAQAGQVLEVRIDGAPAKRHAFAATGAPETIEVALPEGANGRDRVIDLVYAKWSDGTGGDPRPMAVLFLRIQVE